MIDRFPITVIRAPLVEDSRGNSRPDWQQATRTDIPGWAVDAGDTAENTDGRDGTEASWTIRGPFDADVTGSDRVELFGVVCEVVGQVLRQPGATPRTSHSIVRLKNNAG